MAEAEHEGRRGGDADDATNAGEHEAFEKELKEDAAVSGAEGLAQADLLGALGDGDEHDVDDADGAERKGDDTDAAEKDIHGGEDGADGAIGLDGVPLLEGVEIGRLEAVTIGDDLMNFSLGGLVGVFGGGLIVDAAERVEGLVGADEGEVVDGGGDGNVELLIFVVVVATAALGGDADDLETKAVDGDEGAHGGVAHEEEIVGFRAEKDDMAMLGDVVGIEVAALGEGNGADLLDVGLDAPDATGEAAVLAGLFEIAANEESGDVANMRSAADSGAVSKGDVIGTTAVVLAGESGDGTGIEEDDVCAEGGERAALTGAEAFAEADEQKQRGDTPGDAEHGQEGSQLVGCDRLEDLLEDL